MALTRMATIKKVMTGMAITYSAVINMDMTEKGTTGMDIIEQDTTNMATIKKGVTGKYITYMKNLSKKIQKKERNIFWTIIFQKISIMRAFMMQNVSA